MQTRYPFFKNIWKCPSLHPSRRAILTGAVCAGLLLLQVAASGQEGYGAKQPDQQPDTLQIADPTIYYDRAGKEYYLYGTAGDKTVGAGFKGFVSADLAHWTRIRNDRLQENLVLDSAHSFGNKGFWAPQVLAPGKNSGYLMAYTANEQIAIAVSAAAAGPFIQNAPFRPLFHDRFRHIDPFIFKDPVSGKTYIYYVKLDGGNKIYVAGLTLHRDTRGSAAGLRAEIRPGSEKACIAASLPWENRAQSAWPVTEGPTVLYHKGYYYLFYSANDFRNPDYAVGYATAKSPTGPWKKAGDSPVISRASTGLSGTGHGDVFTDKDGQYYYVFHAHHSHEKVAPRKTFLVRFQFKAQSEGPDKIVVDEKSVRPLLLSGENVAR